MNLLKAKTSQLV